MKVTPEFVEGLAKELEEQLGILFKDCASVKMLFGDYRYLVTEGIAKEEAGKRIPFAQDRENLYLIGYRLQKGTTNHNFVIEAISKELSDGKAPAQVDSFYFPL